MGKSGATIDYYDRIAGEYNRMMEEDLPNRGVRARVCDYFCSEVPKGPILDFGAGTGLDLAWQLEAGYDVVFYEPSSKMANEAERHFHISEHSGITPLVGVQASISRLQELENQSLEAVFSNFAAFNSIADLKELFSVFADKLKPGGHMICVLTHNFGFWPKLVSALQSKAGFSGNSGFKKVKFEGDSFMRVYYHSRSRLERVALAAGLTLQDHLALEFEDHTLSHFIKEKKE